MKIATSIKNWFQDRRDCKAKRLPNGYIDIVDLYQKGLISAKGTGQTITDIRAEIVSRVNVPLKVSVAHGTYFVSRGNHQNMVTRRKYQFDLRPLGSERIRVPASCINASLPIPNEKDKFSGVSRVPDKVRRFMEAAEGEDAMVIQAGVWTLTDGYSRQRIQSALRKRRVSTRYGIPLDGITGSDEGPAISIAEIERAKAILDRLRISHNL
ncbi:MAG: hypothetical protein ABSA83_22730 [Verrucomicrobiota bacterium]|jgi:hypothetical protein